MGIGDKIHEGPCRKSRLLEWFLTSGWDHPISHQVWHDSLKIVNVFKALQPSTDNSDVIYCFAFRSRIFHSYEDVTIAGKGLVAKFKPMLGAQGLWAGNLYRITPAVTRGLRFSDLIRRTSLCSRLLRHTRGCGGSILTRILERKILQQDMIYNRPSTFAEI
jgi:hypothetical protein